jgi:hypothetical protein
MLLTACGGGGSDDGDKIQPPATTAAAPTTTAATPSPTATQAAAANAPKFALPSDLTVDIQGFDSADSSKKDLLRDAGYAITSLLEAEAGHQTTETANFKRYWTGPRGAEYADTIIARIKSGKLITGTYRYYAPTVKPGASGAQVVAYCEDQRKAYDKDAKTGKAAVTTPSLSDYRSWSLVMRKGTAGNWQVTNFDWAKGAKTCQAIR